jgi:hypothetical protein
MVAAVVVVYAEQQSFMYCIIVGIQDVHTALATDLTPRRPVLPSLRMFTKGDGLICAATKKYGVRQVQTRRQKDSDALEGNGLHDAPPRTRYPSALPSDISSKREFFWVR